MNDAATSALKRYRVMALVVGLALAILTVLIIVFGLGATAPKTFSPFHGVCYVVYLATLPSLMRHFVVSKKQLALCVLSGIIPGLAFYVERVTMASPVPKEVTQ
jgi:integral membrane protein